jgi:hypothetical protein
VVEAERGAADGEREREMTEPKGAGNFDSDGALSEMELAVRGDGRERTVSEPASVGCQQTAAMATTAHLP